MKAPWWRLAVAGIALGLSTPLGAQTRGAEIIRGHVRTDSGAVVRGAQVIVTRAPDRLYLQTLTDSAGAYEIVFAEGSGDYLVHISAPTRRVFRRRLTRTGPDSVLVLDATLVPEAVQLTPVVVRGRRSRPTRGPEFGVETGAAEQLVDGFPAQLTPEQEGDVAAIAATAPGVVDTPDGPSVLGLPPNQSNTTLNGMAFAGGEVPRDAHVEARVSSSTYDPARGGFSAGQVALELAPGSLYSNRRGHLTLDAPSLQLSDPAIRQARGEFTRLAGSVGADGELVPDRIYYNGALQVTRRTTPAFALTQGNSWALRAAQVSPDSISRLLARVDSLGVPIGRLPSAQTTDGGSLIVRLDRTPYADVALGVVAYGRLSRSDAFGAAPTLAPSLAGRRTLATGGLQGSLATYSSGKVLNEARLAYTVDRSDARPYSTLPTGRVLLTSRLDDGTFGLSSAGFGGNGALGYRSDSWTLEATNETQWYTATSAHRRKIYVESRVDGSALSTAGNERGTFTYNSLADLETNRPAAYTRAFGTAQVSATQWSGAAAVGDLWLRSPEFHVLYGARLEGNRFITTLPFNPRLLSQFGVRSDELPSTVHVSPRLGFTWIYAGAKNNQSSRSVGNFGTRIRGPVGALRGGIGEFRSLLPTTLPFGASAARAGMGGVRELRCLGPEVPIPAWAEYSADPNAVPTQCSSGADSALADEAPYAEVFDRHYRPPRSWRANLSWSSRLGSLGLGAEIVYSLNLDQPATFDLNFASRTAFILPNEGGRPVFVDPASIVPASGFVSPVGARRVAGFGRVLSRRSDSRSVSRQLILSVLPRLPWPQFLIGASYTLSDTRADVRGFDAPTFESPIVSERGPSTLDVRHQVLIQAGWARPSFALMLFGRIRSGLPFTPVVASDINGDGLANDRAFIFAPGESGNGDVDAGLRQLATDGAGAIRDCLARQRGRPAARNSCRGSWTHSLNGRLRLGDPFPQAGTLRDRVRVSLNFYNITAGVDQLLHPTGKLHGWGDQAAPDPVLYRVAGFDSAARRFRYEVNPHFGATEPARSLVGAPFQITLDVSVNWGRSPDAQQIERALRPIQVGAAFQRRSADSLAVRYARTVPDVYARVLAEGDSLLLTRDQFDALNAARAAYRQKVDAIWLKLAQYLTQLPASYDMSEALRYQDAATSRAWEETRLQGEVIRSILSPLQSALLPESVRVIIDAKPGTRFRRYM